MGGEPGTICAPVPLNGDIVFGDVIALVDGQAPVTISSVELVDAVGIEVVGSYVVPVDGGSPIMTMLLTEPTAGWSDRRRAKGETLGAQPVNVALQVQRSGAGESKAAALRVTYTTEDGATHYDDGSTSLRLADVCP